MPFLLRAAAWIVLHLAFLVAGAFIGAALSPKVNPHNDWGATAIKYSLVGAFVGSSCLIIMLMWCYENKPRVKCDAGGIREI